MFLLGFSITHVQKLIEQKNKFQAATCELLIKYEISLFQYSKNSTRMEFHNLTWEFGFTEE